jgi:hypothetical protein
MNGSVGGLVYTLYRIEERKHTATEMIVQIGLLSGGNYIGRAQDYWAKCREIFKSSVSFQTINNSEDESNENRFSRAILVGRQHLARRARAVSKLANMFDALVRVEPDAASTTSRTGCGFNFYNNYKKILL